MKSLLFILALLFASPAWATTYYVAATGGNDANSCAQAQSESTPKATMNAGVGCLSGGDTLQVKNGTYAESFTTAFPSGTVGNPTIINNFAGHAPVAKSTTGSTAWNLDNKSYITFDGIKFDGSNHTDSTGQVWRHTNGTNNITFKNFEMWGNIGSGFSMVAGAQTSNITIQDCIMRDMGGGSQNAGSYPVYNVNGVNVIIERCEIYNVARNGIKYGEGGSGDTASGEIRYNRIRDWGLLDTNPAQYGNPAIQTSNYAGNLKIHSNLIHTPRAACGSGVETFAIWIHNTNSNVEIMNNVLDSDGCANMYLIRMDGAPSAPVTMKNNVFIHSGSTGTVRNDTGETHVYATNRCDIAGTGCATTGAMGFVDEAGHNYNPTAGSALRDAGTDLGASYATDFAGVSRPQGAAWDIGAYEYSRRSFLPIIFQ